MRNVMRGSRPSKFFPQINNKLAVAKNSCSIAGVQSDPLGNPTNCCKLRTRHRLSSWRTSHTYYAEGVGTGTRVQGNPLENIHWRTRAERHDGTPVRQPSLSTGTMPSGPIRKNFQVDPEGLKKLETEAPIWICW